MNNNQNEQLDNTEKKEHYKLKRPVRFMVSIALAGAIFGFGTFGAYKAIENSRTIIGTEFVGVRNGENVTDATARGAEKIAEKNGINPDEIPEYKISQAGQEALDKSEDKIQHQGDAVEVTVSKDLFGYDVDSETVNLDENIDK